MGRVALGFDRPLHEQYLSYLWTAFTSTSAPRCATASRAMEIVLGALPATIELTFAAMLFAILLAIPFGIFAALTAARALDGGIMTLAMFGQSIPSFWLGS